MRPFPSIMSNNDDPRSSSSAGSRRRRSGWWTMASVLLARHHHHHRHHHSQPIFALVLIAFVPTSHGFPVVPHIPPPPPIASSSSSPAVAATATTPKRRHRVYDELDDSWKDGEYGNGTSTASKLLFNYARPLLDIASHRRLEVNDAFRVPRGRSMEYGAVTRLRDVYGRCRDGRRGIGRGVDFIALEG